MFKTVQRTPVYSIYVTRMRTIRTTYPDTHNIPWIRTTYTGYALHTLDTQDIHWIRTTYPGYAQHTLDTQDIP